MGRKTNEQIKQEREEKLNAMTPEEREATLALESAVDNYLIMMLKQKYNVNAELIPNDPNHIKIDGVVMGHNEFAGWLLDKQMELEESDDDSEKESTREDA